MDVDKIVSALQTLERIESELLSQLQQGVEGGNGCNVEAYSTGKGNWLENPKFGSTETHIFL